MYWKFIDINRENTEMMTGNNTYDLTNLRSSIMNLVKKAHNGIRLLRDLRAELGFTNTYREKVNFTSAVRKLSTQGYVERIYVFKPQMPNRKYYCIKYIKDLPADDEADESEEEEEFNDFSDEEGENAQPTEEEGKTDADLQDLSSMDVVQTEPSVQSRARVLFNQYYPLENQISYFIDKSGVHGVPGVEVTYKLTGSSYIRILTRIFSLLVGNGTLGQAKMNKYLDGPMGYLVVIRGVDFSARMKYYRYFSNMNYAEFTNSPKHPSWGEFRSLGANGDNTLVHVNKKSLIPIPGRANIHWNEDGAPQVVFFGEVAKKRASGVPVEVAPQTPSTKKRGRPRKDAKLANGSAEATPTKAKKPRKSKKGQTPSKTPSKVDVIETVEAQTVEVDPSLLNPEPATERPTESTPLVRKRTRTKTPVTETPIRKRTRSSTKASATPSREDTPSGTSKKATKQSTIDSFFSGARPKSKDKSASTENVSDMKAESIAEANGENVQEVSDAMDIDELPSVLNEVPMEELTSEAQVSKAIESAMKQYNEGTLAISPVPESPAIETTVPESPAAKTPVPEPPAAETPSAHSRLETPGRRVKHTPVPRSHAISIVMLKRVDQVVQLLRANDGIMQGGMHLVHALNKKFAKENGSAMDKKTVMKVIEHLENTGEIWQIVIPIADAKPGMPHSKSLLISKTIAKDDPRIEPKRNELVNEVRVNAEHPRLKIEQNEFKVYAAKLKEIELRRIEVRQAKIKAREAKKQMSEQRLEKKDKELREVRAKENQKRKITKAEGVKKKKSFINGIERNKDKGRKEKEEEKKMEREKEKEKKKAAIAEIAAQPTARRTGHNMEGDDPLLSLPLENQDFRNSKRISLARDETNDAPKRLSMRLSRKRIRLTISTDMFFRITVICKCFYSSSHNFTNWERIANAIPNMTPEHAKSLWPAIRDEFGDTKKVNLIMKSWEKIFIQAYTAGDLPIFKDNNYDLAYLARFWARKYPRINEQLGVPLLFEDQKANEAQFIFKPTEVVYYHDAFFTAASMVKHEIALVRSTASFPKKPMPLATSQVAKAKVGIKAIIATPDANYDKDKAKEILHTFGVENCAIATREMDHEKSIVFIPRSLTEQRVIPERNFVFSEKFMSALHQRLGIAAFHELAGFYDELLGTLAQAKGYIMARMAPDSSLACVLDMIAHERVDLVRVNADAQTGAPNHNSRAIDRNKWECDIVVRTPLRYVESGAPPPLELVARPAPEENPVPLGEACSTIWTGVNGKLSEPILRKLVCWTLVYIEGRPGVTADSIQKRLQFVISREEVDTLLAWLERQRCLEKREFGGYWILPEWYAHIGIGL